MDELIYPDAAKWINALEAGQQAGMTQRRNAAASSAGGKMAAGDYHGAAADLYGAGDIQSGVAISRIGADEATQAHKLARQQAVQQKLAAGDIAGAYEDAGIDADLIGALDKVAAHSKETTATLAGALQALKDPATGQWLPPELARARYQEIKPTLQARGIDPRMLDGFDPTPDNLESIQGQVLGLKEQLDMVHRGAVEAETQRHNKVTEKFLGVRAVQPGGTIGVIDPDASTGPATAPAAGGGTKLAEIVTGAIPGARITSTLRTPAENAAVDGVSNSEHLTPDHAVDFTLGSEAEMKAAAAHINSQGGGLHAIYEGAGSAHSTGPHVHVQRVEGAAAAPAGPGYRTLYTAPPEAPQWHSDGQGNLINDKTGDRKIDPTASADAVANPDLVKAIIDGRAPAPTANRAATDPKWQAAMAEAMAQDPTLDAANYGKRVKTLADFATGAAAKTKTALNTALGHAGDLDGQIDALHNSGIQPLNVVGNAVGTRISDDRRAAINTFNLTKEALMHEAMKVFSGSAGSLTEFEQLASTLEANDGPKSQHAVLRKLVGLLASKMDALGEQYKTGMGKELDQSQIMSPHAQDVFAKISGLPRSTTHATAASGQPTTPPIGAVVKGYRFLGGNPADPHSWAKN
jgi:hypothetical protein